MTLLEFILRRDFRHNERQLSRVRVPRYAPSPRDHNQVAMWKVMLQQPEDYLTANGLTSWPHALQVCAAHNHTLPDYMPAEQEHVDIDEESLSDWRALLRSLPEAEPTETLGYRAIDVAADYHTMLPKVCRQSRPSSLFG